MNALLGAAIGIGVATGVLLIVVGFKAPHILTAPSRSTRPATTSKLRRALQLRTPTERVLATAGLTAGIALAVLQGWILAAVALPLIAVGLPRLLSAPTEVDIERLEAMEEWTRALSGVVMHTGLSTAITATLPAAPAALNTELTTLVARIQAGRPLTEALYALGEDLDDQTGDYIVAALVQAADAKNAGLREGLEAIAADVAREVRNRRDVRTEQAAVFSTARLTAGLIVTITAVLILTTNIGEFYRTPAGQVILAGLIAAFAACLIWLRARATFTPPPRFLLRPNHAQEVRS